jgi:hypothetical protein
MISGEEDNVLINTLPAGSAGITASEQRQCLCDPAADHHSKVDFQV